MDYKYFRLQILEDNPSELQRKTNELKKFAKLFHAPLHKIPYRDVEDTFLLDIPDDFLDFCHLANAVQAYCHYHTIANRLASERITVPLDVFLKNLSLE